MQDFPLAEQMRATTEEKKKVIAIQEILEKYQKKAKDRIETATRSGNSECAVFIAENDNIINIAISKRLDEFLKEKGYATNVMDTDASVMLHIEW